MPDSEYFMMIATMCFPTGIIIGFEFESLHWLAVVLLLMAMISWGVGLLSLRRESKNRTSDREVTNKLIGEARRDIALIIGQLAEANRNTAALIEEIRKDREDRKDAS